MLSCAARSGFLPCLASLLICLQHIACANASTWVFVACSHGAESRIRTYVNGCPQASDQNPFELHVIIIDYLMFNWRPFVVHLTETINEQVRRIGSGRIQIGSLTD